MTDLRSVIAYLADVAEADQPPRPSVGSVVWVGSSFQAVVSPQSPRFDSSTRRRLVDLAAVDSLHKEEHLVHEGRLWIVGAVDGTTYRWPMVRRPVSLGGRLAQATQQLTSSPLGPWELSPGLVDATQLRTLALADDIWNGELFTPDRSAVEPSTSPQLTNLVQTYLELAGLPEMPIVVERSDQDDGRAAHIVAGSGYYLERHPFALDRPALLRLWAAEDLTSTAVDALYGGGAGDAPDDRDPRPLTPLPLNGPQRQAISAAARQPLTVVAGPPGTGKSHLVAATAISEVAAGRSVLIAAQSMHACDVVGGLLDRYPMVEAMRFGDTGSARALGDRLAAGVPPEDDHHDADALHRRLDDLDHEMRRQRERIAERITQATGFDEMLRRRDDIPLWLSLRGHETLDLDALIGACGRLEGSGWWTSIPRGRARRLVRRELGPQAPLEPDALRDLIAGVEADRVVTALAGRSLGLSAMWDELERLEEGWRHLIGDYLEAVRRRRAGRRSRAALGEYAAALRHGPTTRRELFTKLGDRFLEVVPLWLGTLGEIEATLPVAPGLFDLVILDEASQISQLSTVPALARAKRAMIVGDSRQLRHVSFVSTEGQRAAADRHELSAELRSRLDDRANSLFDAAAAVAPVVELNEHFRSVPHIIGFSDRTFYDGRLRLMTQHPRNESRDAVEVRHLQGERDASGVVAIEVTAAVALVRDLMDAGVASIGVISPFRAQADALEAAMLDGFTLEEIDAHELRVGTVHGFQGTERDHVIISLGIGVGDNRARAFIENPAIFNVMVTRARRHVTVLSCVERNQAGSGLLAAYFRHADEPPRARRPNVRASGWTQRLAAEIADNTTSRVITDYEVAGETIDIVVGSDERAIGLETDLHPAGIERHVERHLALRRAGWTLESMYRAGCYGREEEAIAGLLARFA